MEKVRICLIGAGRAGMVHANNIIQNVKKAILTAIVDENEETLELRKKELEIEKTFTNVDDALEWGEFDAVVVVTPTFTHKDITIKASIAGKHIFCEKPMSVKVEDAKEMIYFVEKNNVILIKA